MIQILYFRNNNTVKKDENRHGGNPPICRRVDYMVCWVVVGFLGKRRGGSNLNRH